MTIGPEQVEYLDDLVVYIQNRRVVPIVGPELVTVPHEDGELPLDRYLATRLADRLRVAAATLPPDYSLSHVVGQYTLQRGKPGQVPLRLLELLTERPLPTPAPLRKLARIRQFRLFVTTTFDTLLAQAINEVRFGGVDRVRQLTYAPNRASDSADLDASWESASTPTVFHLLGKVSSARDFVITEEDTLEFLHALHSESRRPLRLFDQLSRNHLLFVGCRFPDWLARFVLRMTRRIPLSPQRDEMEVVADGRAFHDTSLTLFLDQFSFNTKVFPGDAIEFVNLLVERWEAKYPDDVMPEGAEGASPADAGMAPGSVFVSYASEDREAAERLCDGLTDFVDVWLDRQQLRAGQDWETRVRHNIRQCALFVPLLSRNAAGRDEGFFRAEWNAALRRAENINQSGRPFVVPVAIDDLPVHAAGVPDDFWARHVARLPGGGVTEAFRRDLVTLVRRARRA